MGHRGHCRVRPVHIAGLVKRYRQLLGEKRHVEIHSPGETGRIVAFAAAISALAEGLAICDPDINLSVIRPISFRTPDPLPGTSLTRAVLLTLRLSQDGLTANRLAAAIAERHSLCFSAWKEQNRFQARINASLNSLAAKQVIRQSGEGRWSL